VATPPPPPDDDTSFAALRDVRPQEHAIARQLGLRRLLGRVLGRGDTSTWVGRFVLEQKVGEGGMGVVYRGIDPSTSQQVAVKLLEHTDPRARTRFAHEAEVLRTLRHERIVRYLDHGTTAEGFDYLVMEWLEGNDLSHVLRRGPLPIADAVRAGYEAAMGLGAAHAGGVLHRDVKPSNLFLEGGSVTALRIIDFGIAHAEHMGTRLTSTGAVVGTPHYMAPEQARGAESVRTDVYSLGATLYECLTGTPPFSGEHPAAVLLAVMAEPAPSARATRPEVPRELDALLGRMMAKDPRDRPRDMSAVITELGDLLGVAEGRSSAPAFSLAEREPMVPVAAAHESQRLSSWALRGRARELAALHGEVAACEEDGLGAVVLLSGAPGEGKSALLGGFVRELRTARPDVLVLDVVAQEELAGAPFATLRAVVQHASAAHGPGPDGGHRGPPKQGIRDALQAMTALLGVVDAGAAHHALGDLAALADRLRGAWFDLLQCWYARGPVVFVVDDAHFVDLSSLRFLRRAMDFPTENARLLVLAGPPGAAFDALARGLSPRQLVPLVIGPLGRRSAHRFAADCAPTLTAAQRERIVAASGGNPASIRALGRAMSDTRAGQGESPWQHARERLAALSPESRRVVRAVSLVQGAVDPALIARLLGVDVDSPQLREQLQYLVRLGLLRAVVAAGADGGLTVEIEDEFLRRAAHESSTEEDLRRGHREVGRWLAGQSGAAPMAVLRHLRAADALAEAGPHFLRAVRHALAGDDAALVEQLVSEGLRCTADANVRGLLEAARAEACFWSSDLRGARAAALAARELLTPGSSAHFETTGLALTAAGQLGDNQEVRQLLGVAAAQAPAPDARDARLLALCRGITQLSASSDADAARLVEAVEAELGQRTPAAATLAWVERMRAWKTLGAGLDDTLACWMRAHSAHLRAGDPRSAAQIHIYLGSLYVWTGAWERARAVLDEALHAAERLDSAQLRRSAQYTACKRVAEEGSYLAAQAAIAAVLSALEDSPRMQAGAHVYQGLSALRHQLLDEASSAASRAVASHQSPVIALASEAITIIVAAQCGRPEGLLDATRALEQAVARAGVLPEFDALVELALVKGFAAVGECSRSDALLRAACARLETRAQTLADPVARSHYTSRPYAHLRLFELAAKHHPG
jgi:hypothetical protein